MISAPHFFIGIPVIASISEKLSTWQVDLQKRLPYKVWPHQEDLHITLKFLGAVEDDVRVSLQQVLQSMAMPDLFSVRVGSLETFGSKTSPRVLFAGVEKHQVLDELYQKVKAATDSVGFSTETRAYHPHITLAKKWSGNPIAIESLLRVKESYQNELYSMPVHSMVLYRIHPSKSPKYEVVERYNLERGE